MKDKEAISHSPVPIDPRGIASLQTLADALARFNARGTRIVAGILLALWDRKAPAPDLAGLKLLDPVTLEHVINVIRLAALDWRPLHEHLDGGAEIFQEISRLYGTGESAP